ncbi:hypothetical protein SDC9_90339 [bioreactor metagenome]|uniref:Uncharacterized protein n=1 Tax=bioreactor metagenome TaxID=1076179 RepID=A0A644ZS34_9ZZZZ
MQNVHARHGGKHFTGQMDGGAVARRCVGELARLLLGVSDDFLDRLVRALGGVHHQHVGHHGQQADGREVLHRVIAQLGVQRLVGGHADGGDHDGVAVARLLGHIVRTDVAARAGAVFHHHGLAQHAARLVAQRAGDHVHGASGRERHNPLDRLGGPVRVGLRHDAGGDQASGGHRGSSGHQGKGAAGEVHDRLSLGNLQVSGPPLGRARAPERAVSSYLAGSCTMAEGWLANGVTWMSMYGNSGRPDSNWCSSSLLATSNTL